MSILVLPEQISEGIYRKSDDPACLSLSGWVSIGRFSVYEAQYTGTIYIGDKLVEQSEPIARGLPGSSRYDRWQYIGDDVYYGLLENGQTVYYFLSSSIRLWTHEKIVFCGCDPKELDCGDCCINCCNLIPEILAKLQF